MADSNNKYYGNLIPLTGGYDDRDVRLIGTNSINIEDLSTAEEYKFRFSGVGASISGTENFIPKFTSTSIANSTLRTNATGNLFGVNTTTSTWPSGYTVLDFQVGSFVSQNSDFGNFDKKLYISRNAYLDSADSLWKYKISGSGYTLYEQSFNGHNWYVGNPNLSGGGTANAVTDLYTGNKGFLQFDYDGLGIHGSSNGYSLFVHQTGASGIAVETDSLYSTIPVKFVLRPYGLGNQFQIEYFPTPTFTELVKISTLGTVPIIISANTSGQSINQGLYITATNELWIKNATNQGAYNLQVGGTGIWAAGAYQNGSDLALKENIEDISSTLELVKKLKPKSFKYKSFFSSDNRTQSGFVAQDLQEVFADKSYLEGLVNTRGEYLSVSYQNLIAVLVKAIQEQEEKIETLELAIETIKNK